MAPFASDICNEPESAKTFYSIAHSFPSRANKNPIVAVSMHQEVSNSGPLRRDARIFVFFFSFFLIFSHFSAIRLQVFSSKFRKILHLNVPNSNFIVLFHFERFFRSKQKLTFCLFKVMRYKKPFASNNIHSSIGYCVRNIFLYSRS